MLINLAVILVRQRLPQQTVPVLLQLAVVRLNFVTPMMKAR